MSRWTLKFLQILKDRGSVIICDAPDDHHLFMMFSFAFPMDSSGWWPLLNSLLYNSTSWISTAFQEKREDVATPYTKKRLLLLPTFFFKTFYALKKSNLENNRAKERVQKERKRKVWNCFWRKTMLLFLSVPQKLEPFVIWKLAHK